MPGKWQCVFSLSFEEMLQASSIRTTMAIPKKVLIAGWELIKLVVHFFLKRKSDGKTNNPEDDQAGENQKV